MDQTYTLADLVSFGNYLLGDQRDVSGINKNNVTHADLNNWNDTKKVKRYVDSNEEIGPGVFRYKRKYID